MTTAATLTIPLVPNGTEIAKLMRSDRSAFERNVKLSLKGHTMKVEGKDIFFPAVREMNKIALPSKDTTTLSGYAADK